MALSGTIPEQRVSLGVFRTKWSDNRGLFLMAIALGALAICLALITIYTPGIIRLTVSVSVALLLMLGSFYVLPKNVGHAAVFLFLADVLQVNLSGALHYFFTASEHESVFSRRWHAFARKRWP
tara:strand:+ start:148 stop:519 length:372 start_codon:yes stop_codon:yes gene_type:complete